MKQTTKKATAKKEVAKIELSKIEVKANELLENDDSLRTLKNNFLELEKKGCFRVGSKNELLDINQLIVKAYYDSLIGKLIQENSKMVKDNKVDDKVMKSNIAKIENYTKEKNSFIIPVKANHNYKSELSNFDKKLFFSLNGKELLLTSCKLVNDKIDKSTLLTLTVNNTTETVTNDSHFLATKALQTAFSDASDTKFYKLELVNNNLQLEVVDCKNMKSRFYGILGTAKKDNSIA